MTPFQFDLAASVTRATAAFVGDFLARGKATEGASRSTPENPSPPATSARIAVALSGGRDSMVLLHALRGACTDPAATLRAVHVHHGLSPRADEWARFCEEQCATLQVPLEVARVRVLRSGGESTEAVARERRYEVLLAADADVIALAHHADDQAETLLLRLLRGAGPHGLAAMRGRATRNGGVPIARPLLEVSSAALAAYAQIHALRWIEDESNADTRHRRNALRHRVTPLLREIAPGYPATLLRAARHQAEAADLLDDLAAIDAGSAALHDAALGLCLDAAALGALAALSPARARNLLRWFVREHGLRAPTSARLEQMLLQCTTRRRDARAAIRHDGARLAIHRGHVVVHPDIRPAAFSLRWRGEAEMPCPGGTLRACRSVGSGISADVVASGSLRLAPRAGGERMRLTGNRPPQAVSTLFQRRGTPLWQRPHWPLVWRDDILVAVPGLGIDPAYLAASGAPGYELHWHPAR